MACVISWPVLLILIILIANLSREETEDRSWTLNLPKMKGRHCEVELKENNTSPLSLPREGLLVDLDDEWILVRCEIYNGEIRKELIRISEIKSVKVID